MQRAATFFGSSIGKKVVMAVTGLVLFGFVIGHMVGNLQIYLGPEAINDYAEFLQHFLHGAGIWIARGSLLVAVGLHIWAAVSLTLASWRPARWATASWQARESTYASRTMRVERPDPGRSSSSTTCSTSRSAPCTRSFVEGDVYHNVVVGFQNAVRLGVLHPRDGAPWACTCTTASGACSRRSASATRAGTRCGARRRSCWPGSWCSATSRSRSPCSPASSTCRGITMELKANVPSGPIEKKWEKHRFDMKLVNPANKRKYTVIVVGIGPGGRRRRRLAGRARLQRQVLLLPGLARAAPTPSPRRAASTPPRTTRTTATASTGSSTTPSRAATSAPARPTSTGWPRCR